MSTKQIEALKLALEALESDWDGCVNSPKGEAIAAIREALAEPRSDEEQPAQQQEPIRVPVTDNTYGYAKSLAEAIFKQHFASDEHYASGRIVWGVNDTVIGILTQIDNMVADMVRRPAQQQEPVAWMKDCADFWEHYTYISEASQENYKAEAQMWVEKLRKSPQPSKPWVGLTDEEFQWIYDHGRTPAGMMELAEAKLREKNA